VCQVARIWMNVSGFHKRLPIIFIIFRASVRNILDIPLYVMMYMYEERPHFLGALEKWRKATISFCLSVCPSLRPHGTTRPLIPISLLRDSDKLQILTFLELSPDFRN
jgi:hypothetical protein